MQGPHFPHQILSSPSFCSRLHIELVVVRSPYRNAEVRKALLIAHLELEQNKCSTSLH